MPYKKYDPKVDELREGMRVRLAGREGVIFGLHLDTITYIAWGNDDNVTIRLDKFPDVEIFVQPLTIPKRTKEFILKQMDYDAMPHWAMEKLLDSLEVTND